MVRLTPGGGSVVAVRLCRLLALSLALVLAQQATLHELGHCGRSQVQDTHDKQDDGQPCALCLASAKLDANATATPPALKLLDGLRHVWAERFATGSRRAPPPVPRNRGPPFHF
jgi:hypothetical protein